MAMRAMGECHADPPRGRRQVNDMPSRRRTTAALDAVRVRLDRYVRLRTGDTIGAFTRRRIAKFELDFRARAMRAKRLRPTTHHYTCAFHTGASCDCGARP